MKTALVLLAGAIVLAGAVPAAHAAEGDLSGMIVALHLQALAAKNNCDAGQAGTAEFGCDAAGMNSSLVVNGTVSTSYDMYIVCLDIPPNPGMNALELGIDYDPGSGSGLDHFGATTCSDLVFEGLGWPNSGGAATYTWTTCQDAVDATDPQGEASAVAATIYAFAYGADTACIDIKPSGIYGVSDCDGAFSDLTGNFPDNSGCAGFDQPGTDPCLGGTPVEERTWGDIKRYYND